MGAITNISPHLLEVGQMLRQVLTKTHPMNTVDINYGWDQEAFRFKTTELIHVFQGKSKEG